jgi:hypothetical protein
MFPPPTAWTTLSSSMAWTVFLFFSDFSLKCKVNFCCESNQTCDANEICVVSCIKLVFASGKID